ncbi:phosphatidylinositol-4,5-bisphosphate 3-kinase [Strigomonas culicis]|nr:phosphatidylinositol-4,5-bisphosphate 3-kinase [Strigomonas culicis]|eukprot:EPY26748.1 phosphatidylinositol-4,5-bisphosphate 3-kinase [Strigomonas culicis]
MLKGLNPKQPNDKSGAVIMRIWYVDLAGCATSTVHEFSFDTVADYAISYSINQIASFANVKSRRQKNDTVFIFRVKGRNDFIYGSEHLINFRFVRDCVSKRRELNVEIESKNASLLLLPTFCPVYRSQTVPNQKHKDLCKRKGASQISIWSLSSNLSLKLIGSPDFLERHGNTLKTEEINDFGGFHFAIFCEAYYGTSLCAAPQVSSWKAMDDLVGDQATGHALFWNDEEITFDIALCNCPRELKFGFTLIGVPADKFSYMEKQDAEQLCTLLSETTKKSGDQGTSVHVLGTAAVQLFDYMAHMKSGRIKLHLWDSCVNPVQSNGSVGVGTGSILEFILPSFEKTVVLPSGRPPKNMEIEALAKKRHEEEELNERLNEIEQLRQLKRIIAYDPLCKMTTDDKTIVWKYKDVLVNRPQAMSKFLSSVDWTQPYDVYMVHILIRRWCALAPFDALELLDAKYADTVVREQAIRYMEGMTDYDLHGCILQLVQVLKFEPYYYCALSRFLLRRSLKSNHVVGHYVFWYLTAEVKNMRMREFHGLLLEEFIKRTPLRRNYLRQVYVSRELLGCALEVQRAPKKDRIECLKEALSHLTLPHHFTLPLNPAVECSSVEINDCKVMDSKKFPLFLVFRNHLDADDRSFVIFKSGDDLRQDLLTLQLLELMDTIWKANGLDLHIIPYGCISTGEGVGMIEVVLNSDTLASITRKDGGAQAAFSEQPLLNWLRCYNKERSDVERCLWNFVFSVAGYTVATYILGIGDRHNDNIMLRKDGTLFHIDFGHFLGNFKTKFGFKRETAPFILTPMYVHVMGGLNKSIFRFFMDVACEAYNVIRRCSNVFIMLFILMLSTGIPELSTKDDIEWLRTVLLIGRSDTEASKHYKQLINMALNNKRTLINDYIHIMVH